MATDAQILTVRREARLHKHEYFTDKGGGSKLELIKDQPPITIVAVTKNGGALTINADYTFDGYRTISLSTIAGDTDVYEVELGTTCSNTIIGDVIDYATEEVYSALRLYWSTTALDQSNYISDLVERLAAGYLIMKYWEGHTAGEDFWKHGRNLVDEVHKRLSELKDGERQLLDATTVRAGREYTPFNYKILEQAPGLIPSGLYTQSADDLDYEEY